MLCVLSPGRCRVQKDDSGRPRGFGFVSFDAPSSAQAFLKFFWLGGEWGLCASCRLPLQGCSGLI